MYNNEIVDSEHGLIESIKKEVSVLVKQKVKEEHVPSSLKTFHQKELELKHTCFHGFNEYLRRIKEGHAHLLQEQTLGLKEEELTSLIELLNHQTMEISTGEILQDKLQISDKTLMASYQYGSDLFQRKNFAWAADVFLFLCTLNPKIPSFWIALGRAEEFNKQDESALLAYTMAMELDHEDLSAVFDCVRCLKRLQRFHEADLFLDKALECARECPNDYEEFHKQVMVEKSKK